MNDIVYDTKCFNNQEGGRYIDDYRNWLRKTDVKFKNFILIAVTPIASGSGITRELLISYSFTEIIGE